MTVEAMAESELSLEEIHQYILEKGGRVANRELVKHFKKYLTHPESKNDARIKFKEYVNTLATSKTEGEEKYIILRSKYAGICKSPVANSPVHLPQNTLGLPLPNLVQNVPTTPSPNKSRQPPPYRPPPPVTSPSPSLDNISIGSSTFSISVVEEPPPPQAPPRRKSQSRNNSTETEPQEVQKEDQQQQQQLLEVPEQAISVKERTQKFNRLASVENDLSPQPQKEKRKQPESGADEDDGASVTSDSKRTEWIVASARGDYQALAKLASNNPRLVKAKDPFTTALHWAAKHGNLDIVKLMAGTYKVDVNARTNGGYTPLHIAMLYGHKDVFKLLVEVYGGDPEMRDWSGRTPIYYLQTQKCGTRTDSYLKLKIHKKSSEKDLGFLRIGSLNVRVKKTTEAFSNFLGVGSGAINPADSMDKVHKSWGSADNVFKDNTEMAAPKLVPNKRKIKQSQDHIQSHSTPSTPNQKRSAPTHHQPDSDSDTACGFDSNWKN